MKGFLNFFTILGLLFLAAAAIVYRNGAALRDRSELTTGTVTGMSVSTNSDNITSYCPQIAFTTRDGQDVIHYPNVCSTQPQYENGEQVEIFYDPENPDEAQVKGFWTQYGITTLLGGIGLPIFVVGIFVGWLARPAATRKKK